MSLRNVEKELRNEIDGLRTENIILREKTSQYEKICENASSKI